MNTRLYQDEEGTWWHQFSLHRRTKARECTCQTCKKQFFAYPEKQFCSPSCQHPVGTGMVSRECVGCKRSFLSKEKVQHYCSRACASRAMQSKKSPTTSLEDVDILNSDNPRYSQDETGQWWYQPSGTKVHSRTRAYIRQCKSCGKSYLSNIFHKHQEYCSRRCAPHPGNPDAMPPHYRAEKHGRWKGGRFADPRGYIMVYCPDHPSRANTDKAHVQEHRLVMEKIIGRYLRTDEIVHHKNGVKSDNRPENLEIWDKGHPAGQRIEEKRHCPTCTCFDCK